ncbi:hypothetical protein, partial [Shewanella sp. c952]|uniref:hypothetical protein n=1 Tax=Shewanella sp. c952 TaxID=2815913 RepID=UPI001C7DEF7B
MTKSPLIKYFNHVPDKCSITRAAKAFGLDKEDFLNWAHDHAIKLYVSLDIGLGITGNGEEINDYMRLYSITENRISEQLKTLKQDQAELKRALELEQEKIQHEQLCLHPILSAISLAPTESRNHNGYEALGRWVIPPCYALEFINNETVKIDELFTDFSMMCGVELDKPYTANINKLSIAKEDLQKIAQSLKSGNPLPIINCDEPPFHPEAKKPRKQREDLGSIKLIEMLLDRDKDLTAVKTISKKYDILEGSLAKEGKVMPISKRTLQ